VRSRFAGIVPGFLDRIRRVHTVKSFRERFVSPGRHY
jgi:hypothetical protein